METLSARDATQVGACEVRPSTTSYSGGDGGAAPRAPATWLLQRSMPSRTEQRPT